MTEHIPRQSLFNRALISKCADDGKWLLIFCFIGLFCMTLARGWAVSLVNMESFQLILDNLPKSFQKMFPVDPAWLVSYTGRVSLAYEEPLILFCLATWCVARSSDCVSGQLNRGTLEIYLAQPISRMQWLVTHSLVTIAGIFLLTLASWLGLMTAVHQAQVTEQVPIRIGIPETSFQIPLPMTHREVTTALKDKVKEEVLWSGALNFFCAGLMIAGVTTLLSACDRYRWRTLGIATGFLIFQWLIVIISAIAPGSSWLSWTSILSAYKPSLCCSIADQQPQEIWSFVLNNADEAWMLGPAAYNSTLLLVALGCYLLAAIIFQRRDLPAPV
jgi:ABC-2 type transport system permease protein